MFGTFISRGKKITDRNVLELMKEDREKYFRKLIGFQKKEIEQNNMMEVVQESYDFDL